MYVMMFCVYFSRVASMEPYMEHFLNMPADNARKLYEDHKRNLKVLGGKHGMVI